MGKATNATNAAKRKKAAALDRFIRPTDERVAHNDTESAGAAVRFVPVIVSLRKRELITEREFEALAYYRDQALLADKSPLRSCIDFTPKGNSHGPGMTILSAQIETGRLERELGSLWPLARRVAVEDVTIERVAAESVTARKLQRMTIEEAKAAMLKMISRALLELKFAAGRIALKGA